MKKNLFAVLLLANISIMSQAQGFMTATEGFKTMDIIPEMQTFSNFTAYDTLFYGNDGDTIWCYNLNNLDTVAKFGKPEDYTAFPGFLTISPDGSKLWSGYTVSGNTDDRIYSIDIETGAWKIEARLAGNFDLSFWNDSILVSGLNSANFDDPNSIFVLDTSTAENHRKIIEIGGYSAGLGVSNDGDIFYASSFAMDPNVLYRWDSTDVSTVINDVNAAALTLNEGTKLADLPNGAQDVEVDDAGNVIFNLVSWTGPKEVAVWNGVEGDGNNYTVLASSNGSFDWPAYLCATGDIYEEGEDNYVLALIMPNPIEKISRSMAPSLAKAIRPVSAFADAADFELDLNDYIIDADDDTATIVYDLVANSMTDVVTASLKNDTIVVIDFLSAGQTNIWISASSNGRTSRHNIVVGVQEIPEGTYTVTDFENLSLDAESHWENDGANGEFTSGLNLFNFTKTEWAWSGWTYSNESDVATTGYLNQYSAFTGEGFNAEAGDEIYAVAYPSADAPAKFNNGSAHEVAGFYATNGTYAALSMQDGDDFAKKFGGADGNDPDFFLLTITGMKAGEETGTVDFYLADYRFEDNSRDYIVKTWQWVDLSELGKVDSLSFALSSSDMGAWGMNTPGYFMVDNFYVKPDQAPIVVNPIEDYTFVENHADTIINLAAVFTDPDDDDADIVFTVDRPTDMNMGGVEASIENGTDLRLTFSGLGYVTFNVTATSNGLEVSETFTVTVVEEVSVNAATLETIKLYPNPSNGYFRISTENEDNLSVRIYTISGKEIYHAIYNANEMIDISNQPAGHYIIKISNENSSVVKSLIKE